MTDKFNVLVWLMVIANKNHFFGLLNLVEKKCEGKMLTSWLLGYILRHLQGLLVRLCVLKIFVTNYGQWNLEESVQVQFLKNAEMRAHQ